MNDIKQYPLEQMGYNFIPAEYLPEGKDEYYLRFQQNPATDYRPLTQTEITVLKSNGNRCANWSDILVRDGIDIHLIERCTFYGLVRIGILEPLFLAFSEFRTAVGLYNCLIVSCDIGNNVALKNVRFLSYYIIEDNVIIANVNEMSCTSHAKFGNGVIKDGEEEEIRVWMELCNENGGRKVMPFDGMLPGDAWLWTKYRGDELLMQTFKEYTQKKYDARRGYYGTVGRSTVIKNTQIIKDVKIGSHAYIKGANKLKNLTIDSAAGAKSQIGEGCEMVNGILGYGSRSFYGVKAVRFILGSFSQLKYGARLINSYLGDNSTISCCEVLNSLIFPAHEQHHNNSFLCAAVVQGQSNLAAGATIGSNHNSRGADGEIIAGRGFWPGLCVSLKHNSRFASFAMITKGDYPYELNIPLPFSLIGNEVHTNRLLVMPAYWPLYNMYAILRNERKFADRDKRIKKTQKLEYDFLAPDTIDEIFNALKLLEQFVGKAFLKTEQPEAGPETCIKKGRSLLKEKSKIIDQLEILASGFEHSNRQVVLSKVQQAYDTYIRLIIYYGTLQLVDFMQGQEKVSPAFLVTKLYEGPDRNSWVNLGGQLIPEKNLKNLITAIKTGRINGWDGIHHFYKKESEDYQLQKQKHGLSALLEILEIGVDGFDATLLKQLLNTAVETKAWIAQLVRDSKAKDYSNPFRTMVYDSLEEMQSVIGKLEDNSFINQQQEELVRFRKNIEIVSKKITPDF